MKTYTIEVTEELDKKIDENQNFYGILPRESAIIAMIEDGYDHLHV